MRHKLLTIFFLLGIGLVFSHCASDLDQKIEEARFLLDQGKYTEAIALMQPVVTANPNSLLAQFLLAEAQVGQAAFGDGNSYLNLLSDFLRANDAGQSDFATFARLAPGVTAYANLNIARDNLVTLSSSPDLTDPSFRRDFFFVLYIARIFEVGGVVKKIHGDDVDLVCNANPSDPLFKDGVPDSLDASLATAGDVSRMDNDFHNINSDGAEAGFPANFPLNARITQIDAAFHLAPDAQTFFNAAFGNIPPGAAPCNVPK